jgi:hypothetical protein
MKFKSGVFEARGNKFSQKNMQYHFGGSGPVQDVRIFTYTII